MENFLNILGRSVLVLIILFFSTKLLGKKQISQLSLYDYIVGITIGSVVADISLDIEKDIIAGLSCLFVYIFFSYFVSFISLKSIKLRRFFLGVPTILIERGRIIESGLKKSKIDVNELLAEARLSGYFDISEINYAIMETDGKVSFLSFEDNKPCTRKDFNIKKKDKGIISNVIIDAVILDNNLKVINKDGKWLLHELKVHGYDLKDILLGTLDSSGKLLLYRKNINSEKSTILE